MLFEKNNPHGGLKFEKYIVILSSVESSERDSFGKERYIVMHMADALVAPAVAATMYVASGVTTGISVKTLKKRL